MPSATPELPLPQNLWPYLRSRLPVHAAAFALMAFIHGAPCVDLPFYLGFICVFPHDRGVLSDRIVTVLSGVVFFVHWTLFLHMPFSPSMFWAGALCWCLYFLADRQDRRHWPVLFPFLFVLTGSLYPEVFAGDIHYWTFLAGALPGGVLMLFCRNVTLAFRYQEVLQCLEALAQSASLPEAVRGKLALLAERVTELRKHLSRSVGFAAHIAFLQRVRQTCDQMDCPSFEEGEPPAELRQALDELLQAIDTLYKS